MILVENIKVKQIPMLHIAEHDHFHKKMPFVIFVHGFTSAKEHNLHYAYLLAEKGFRVALPEAIHHGERQLNENNDKLAIHFWDIVLQSIDEIDMIRKDFEEKQLIDPDRIGLVGTSMGGIVTLGSLTKYHWIKAAVSLMGMPCYERFARWQIEDLKQKGVQLPIQQEQLEDLLNKLCKFDLSKQPHKLSKRPLLFWHGKKDPIVPFSLTYDFYQSVKTLYSDIPEKLHFIIDEKSGHKVSREGLLKTVDWFDHFLK